MRQYQIRTFDAGSVIFGGTQAGFISLFGNWFYTSQGRFPVNVGGNEYSNAIMMGHVRSIRWDANGWPLVMPERYGAVPQAPITENEIAGDWEHLALTTSNKYLL